MENESHIVENCKLNMIEIEADIGGKTSFNAFFKKCIENESGKIIPLGILRKPNQ